MNHQSAVANLPVRDLRADGGDRSGGLMPENSGRRNQTVLNFFQIGSAYAAGPDAQQNIARPDHRPRHILYPNIAHPAIHRRLHSRLVPSEIHAYSIIPCAANVNPKGEFGLI